MCLLFSMVLCVFQVLVWRAKRLANSKKGGLTLNMVARDAVTGLCSARNIQCWKSKARQGQSRQGKAWQGVNTAEWLVPLPEDSNCLSTSSCISTIRTAATSIAGLLCPSSMKFLIRLQRRSSNLVMVSFTCHSKTLIAFCGIFFKDCAWSFVCSRTSVAGWVWSRLCAIARQLLPVNMLLCNVAMLSLKVTLLK